MKPYTRIAAAFLLFIAVVHLLRLFTGWEVIVVGQSVPVWLSAPAAILIGTLGVMTWRESRR